MTSYTFTKTPAESDAIRAALAHANTLRIYRPPGKNEDAHCGVARAIYRDHAAVVISEMPSNTGCLVTNYYEGLATAIYNDHLDHLHPDQVTWFEFYQRTSTLERVQLKRSRATGRWQFYAAEWVRIERGLYIQ